MSSSRLGIQRVLLRSVFLILIITVALLFAGCSKHVGSTAKVEGNSQIAETTLAQDAYEPITVEVGTPLRWNMKVAADTLTNCNETILIPSLGIEKTLQPGDNFIEFTPEKTGTITYTCWMGMITSTITVVDSLGD